VKRGEFGTHVPLPLPPPVKLPLASACFFVFAIFMCFMGNFRPISMKNRKHWAFFVSETHKNGILMGGNGIDKY
jgi:hypothetical protein